MRSDRQLPREAFRESQQWQVDPFTNQPDLAIDSRYRRGKTQTDGQTRWHSFSGHERNCFFLNQGGKRFDDLSAVSGLDTQADSRSFALADFDRDGWRDIVLVNANYPLLNLFRNRFQQAQTTPSHFLAVRLIGGNRRAMPSERFSARDAIGAKVTVVAGKLRQTRELYCGEGFAAQNSNWLHFGIGSAVRVNELIVQWPSGKSHRLERIEVDQSVVVYEDAATSPQSRQFVLLPYMPVDVRPATEPQAVQLPLDELLGARRHPRQWHLFTTMATWCDACKRNLPQVAHLRQHYSTEELGMWGVPADSIESLDELKSYNDAFQPAYELLDEITPEARDRLLSLIRRELRQDVLPSTVLTDAHGTVLGVTAGVPQASEVGRFTAARIFAD